MRRHTLVRASSRSLRVHIAHDLIKRQSLALHCEGYSFLNLSLGSTLTFVNLLLRHEVAVEQSLFEYLDRISFEPLCNFLLRAIIALIIHAVAFHLVSYTLKKNRLGVTTRLLGRSFGRYED